MRKGYVLIYTLIIIVAISILSIALLTNTTAYVRNNALEIEKNNAYLSSQKLLQLSLAYIKPYFSGTSGITLSWTSANVSQNIEWWNRFKNHMISQSDGNYWQNFFNRINEQRYFDLSTLSGFTEDSSDISGSSIVLPIAASYQANGRPYSAFLVSRATSGKIEAYSVAVVAVDFLNKYAYFTEKETRPGEQTIYFISKEVIDGPMRSNDIIHISGNPRFKSAVEVKGVDIQSGNPIFDDPFSPKILTQQDIESYRMSMIASNYSSDLNALVKNPVDFVNSTIESGINLNLRTIEKGNKKLVPTKLIVEFKSAPGEGNDQFMKVYVEYQDKSDNEVKTDSLFTLKPRPNQDGYHMVVHGQDAREWLGLQGSGNDQTINVNFNGVLKSNLTIALRNNTNSDKPMYVDGKYTIYSEQNVEIYDHIVYEDFRDLFPHDRIDNIVVNQELVEQMRNIERSDFLNIVANNSVIIKDKQKNMKINASIYAFNESFEVENYDKGDPEGQLTIFGSLMQYYRGPVGTFSGDITVSGYYKNYIYDNKILEGISIISGTPAKKGEILVLTLRGVY
ncbi:MAG TPA: hypothetical protein VIL29_06360 [Pseudothermotoga sp.]